MSFFRSWLTLSVAGAALAGLVTVPATAQTLPDAELASRFTVGVLPDTQFYSRYGTAETGDLFQARYGSQPFLTQTSWLAANDENLNMPFVTHLGDVVDQAPLDDEWAVADEAMAVLEADGLNYSILPGNHDKAVTESGTQFSRHFPASRAANNETFGGRHEAANNESEYHVFEAEGQEYLVLALAWRADAAALAWAQDVIDAHPELPVILTSHEILDIDGNGDVFLSSSYGQGLWENFISKNDQIFLTMGGHHHGAGHTVMKNDAGHDVIHVLQDYQMAYQGGNGLLGLLEFDLSNNTLGMTALSPWVARKPAETLNQFDDLILDAPDEWSVEIDFAERFAAFNPDFTAGDADDPDYSELAKAIVSEGYVAPAIADSDRPVHEADFPKVAGTVAHWRPGATTADGVQLLDGQTAPVGSVIPDVSGNGNDMTRAELNTRGAAGSLESDVTYSSDTHELSSDTGSLVWANQDGDSSSLNWFETAAGAAANTETFDDGYTFETFVKIGADFDGDNSWMGAVSRQGQRGELADDMPEGEEPPAALAVSSLRELQWTAVATEGRTSGTSNWSHEVPKDEWLHVAIVNDPATDTVDMFVNGAPILRDVIDAEGLATVNDPWLIGANMWEGDPANPWYGSIGETRIVHGALSPEQWLTARAEEPAGGLGSQNDLSAGAGSSLGMGLAGVLATAVAGVLAVLTVPGLQDSIRGFLKL